MSAEHKRVPSYASGELSLQTEKKDEVDSTGKNEVSVWSRFMQKTFPGGYCYELKGTMSIAWALIITQICQIYFQPIATMFGGHLGKVELDAIALSNTLINVLGNSIVIGFSTALDTAFSQSYGRGHYEMVGIYFQKGVILTTLLLLPCYALHLNIEPILVAIGQDREVSRLVGQYMLYFMPGMFCLFMWTTVRKFTQCQNAVAPHIFIILSGHAVHAVLQYLFLYQFKFGIVGSAVAQAITFFLLMVVTIIYTLYSASFKLSWGGLDKRCLQSWGELGSLGLHGMLMMCLEWWAFEISVILAGTIGTTELAAQSVTFNLNSLCFAAPSGIAVATCIRIGQLLGANEPLSAKTAAMVGMSITFMNAVVWLTVFASGRFVIPKIFTNVEEVIEMVSGILPILAVFTLGDAITMIGRGVFRGAGKQLWGMVIILIAYYVMAVPLAICLTFLTPLSIKGLWVGFTIAIYTSAIVYFVIINFKLNWQKLAKEAQMRAIGKATGHKSEPDTDEETLLLSDSNEHKDHGKKITKGLIVRRILVVMAFVLILIAGIIARLLTSDFYGELNTGQMKENSTAIYNSSQFTNPNDNFTHLYYTTVPL